ncbi:MAG: tetratricopeptide repeat protein, partial [Clostridium butyricum]|nr:tetratricopeptide repeat protein [Clostridium butyricum]
MDSELDKYMKLLKSSPNDPKLNSWIGNYYKNNNDFIKALKYYKKAFEADSENQYYCKIIGDIYETLGDMNKAQNYYKKAINLENTQIEQGLKKYIDAIKENPSDAEGYFSLGAYYERYKRYEKSLEYYLKAFKINNKSELYCNKVGKIYEKLGEEEKANKYYDAAVELNPSANEKKALLKKIENDERISIKDFFEGNYVQGSFAANACTDEIDVRE